MKKNIPFISFSQYTCLRLCSESRQAVDFASHRSHGADSEKVHRLSDDKKIADLAIN